MFDGTGFIPNNIPEEDDYDFRDHLSPPPTQQKGFWFWFLIGAMSYLAISYGI